MHDCFDHGRSLQRPCAFPLIARWLLPVIIITFLINRLLRLNLCLGTPRGPARGTAGGSADDVVGCVAVCYALLVVGATGLCGLQCICVSLGLDCGLALGEVRRGGRGDGGSSGGFRCGFLVFVLVLGAGGPVYFFFVGGCGCCFVSVLYQEVSWWTHPLAALSCAAPRSR